MGNPKILNTLKEQKVLKEFDLLKFRERSQTLNKKILDTRARLNLAKAQYKKAGDAGLDERQRELSEAMQNMQALLGSLAKQKKTTDHWALEYNEELVKLNTEISREESRHRGLFRLPFSKKGQHKTEAKPEAKKEETKKLTPDLNKKFLAAQWENNMKKKLGLQSKKLTPQDFKKGLNAHLIKDLFKKNSGQAQPKTFAPGELTQQFDQLVQAPETIPQPSVDTSQPKTPGIASQNKSESLASATQTVGAVVGIAKSIKNIVQTVKNVVQVIRIATTSATVVGAVVNIALLLRNKLKKILKAIAKAYAGIQALLILAWLWLLAKLAGVATGTIFGVLTGLPLFAANPAFFTAWVSYWAYKGWTDPLGTIHIATHPWELVTKPLNWIGNQFSGFGAGAKGGVDAVAGGVGGATSSAISTLGSLVTGAASYAWGGITAGLSTAGGYIGSFAGSFMSNLAGAGSAIAGNVVPIAVGGSMATIVGGTVMGTIITNSAFYTQELDVQEEFGAPTQNELFTIAKTANPTRVNKPQDTLDSETATFTVRITALANITITSFSDNMAPTPGSGFTRNNGCSSLPVTTLNLGQTTECTETITINFTQPDQSTITNTATLTATDGTQTETGTAAAIVQVGTAPPSGDCNFEFVTGNVAWTQAEMDTLNAICTTLLGPVTNLLNNAGTITLQRFSGGCSGSVNGGTVVSFSGCNLSSFDSAKYVVVHELGHVIGNVNLALYNNFTSSGAYATEGMIRTYPLCPGSINESFAEMIADYVVAKTYNFPARCTGYPGGPYTTFQADYPMHYNFAKNNIFGGVEY